MKYFRIFIIIYVTGLFCSSCVKKANYPNVPVISYSSFTPFYEGSSAVIDSALLRLNFTDGDGDIGYPSQQQNVSPDLYAIPLVYFYATQTYGPIIEDGDTLTFTYNIPYITPAGNDKELNGIIQINFESFIQNDINAPLSNPPFNTAVDCHNLEFEVWIYDRAGNKSNVLLTPPTHTLPE